MTVYRCVSISVILFLRELFLRNISLSTSVPTPLNSRFYSAYSIYSHLYSLIGLFYT